VQVDPAELSQVVEHLTGSRESGPWVCDQLHEAIASATAGIWRVHGKDWAVVLKLVAHCEGGHRNWQSGRETDHWYYWKREVLAYQSGLTSSFVGGLRGPRCYLISERPDGSVALWLEDLTPLSSATTWPLSRYGLVARHLGRAQGEFLTGSPLPGDGWLSHGWLRDYLVQRDGDVVLLEDRAAWSSPLVRRWLPEELARPLRDLRADQDLFLSVLDRVPATLCHLDLHSANLFGSNDITALIDWSFVGSGALGEDPGNLVADSVLDFHVGPERLDDLYVLMYEGYLAGLQDAGWAGRREIVDLAMSAAIASKYAWIGPAMLRAALDGSESLNGRPIEEAFAWWAPTIPFFLRRAEEVHRLVGILA
jgi:Phosphotransferase enzyme family